MRNWLRLPVPQIPEIPQTPPADPSPVISGICGISDSGIGLENDLLPEGSPPVPTDAAATLARRARFKAQAAAIAALRQPAKEWAAEDWRTRFNERAAIAEFDGGLSRAAAETIAFNDCVSEELYLNPVKSDAADGCVSCGADDRANDPLLAIGLGGGQVWLHRECSTTWHAGRIAEAVAALAAMGITT